MSSSTVLRYQNELQATSGLIGLMEVLKSVASSRFHLFQAKRRQRNQGGDLASRLADLEGFFRLIPPGQRVHPFLRPPSDPLGLVIVTSDEGFLGGLNASVTRKALLTPGAERAELIVLGGRGRTHLTDRGAQVTAFPGVGPEVDLHAVARLRDHVVWQYLEGKVGRVVIFYPRFLSFTRQEVASLQLLPYVCPTVGPEGPVPPAVETILEPSASAIIEYLVEIWLAWVLEEVFWHSKLSEYATRTMHLDKSMQDLADERKKALLKYFRSKHEAMDTSIRESYAGLLMTR